MWAAQERPNCVMSLIVLIAVALSVRVSTHHHTPSSEGHSKQVWEFGVFRATWISTTEPDMWTLNSIMWGSMSFQTHHDAANNEVDQSLKRITKSWSPTRVHTKNRAEGVARQIILRWDDCTLDTTIGYPKKKDQEVSQGNDGRGESLNTQHWRRKGAKIHGIIK